MFLMTKLLKNRNGESNIKSICACIASDLRCIGKLCFQKLKNEIQTYSECIG